MESDNPEVDIAPDFERKSLRDASVQEIQLELLRRTTFNALDGERVVNSLLARRHLWTAAMLDRFALSNPGKLPSLGLIRLRDMPDGFWNADTLYILTPNAEAARELARIIEIEDWGGEVQVHDDRRDVDSALGGCLGEPAVVSVWWD